MCSVISTTYIKNADGTLSRQQQYVKDYFNTLDEATSAVDAMGAVTDYGNGEVEQLTVCEV